jgi:hypothetical protein
VTVDLQRVGDPESLDPILFAAPHTAATLDLGAGRADDDGSLLSVCQREPESVLHIEFDGGQGVLRGSLDIHCVALLRCLGSFRQVEASALGGALDSPSAARPPSNRT